MNPTGNAVIVIKELQSFYTFCIIQHRCFVCHEYAPDNQLIQCSYPGCYRFYHNSVECIGDYILDSDISSFHCPSHYCRFCKSKEDKDNPLMQCSRCIKSYHPSCLPSSICLLNSRFFVCVRHRFVVFSCVILIFRKIRICLPSQWTCQNNVLIHSRITVNTKVLLSHSLSDNSLQKRRY